MSRELHFSKNLKILLRQFNLFGRTRAEQIPKELSKINNKKEGLKRSKQGVDAHEFILIQPTPIPIHNDKIIDDL